MIMLMLIRARLFFLVGYFCLADICDFALFVPNVWGIFNILSLYTVWWVELLKTRA